MHYAIRGGDTMGYVAETQENTVLSDLDKKTLLSRYPKRREVKGAGYEKASTELVSIPEEEKRVKKRREEEHAQRGIVTKLVTSEHSSTAAVMSATLHPTVLALTDAFWHYINSNTVGKINNVQQPKFGISEDQKVSVPLVQVQCQATSLGAALNSNDTLTFETGAMVYDLSKSEPNAYSGATWNVPEKAWKFSRPQPWNTTNITWVNPSDVNGAQGEKLPSSLAAVVTVPAVWSNDGANGTTGFSQGSVVLPCVVDARWATTDVSFDIKEHTLKTSLTDWLDTANLTGGDLKGALSKWDISEPIAISPEWAS
ncbi:hypothetical protein NUW58_g9295 [Xylaria curta]|uniref:Uncharacterized protein n=1 Tax=Xylaria curta TaxID=42375 RepID=A0ACC1MY20_9PEZI|nr:hypothetical protein NUW58_g9295 [Xylaria curta]